MEIVSKHDFLYTYKDFDFKIISDYLNETFKRSTSSYKNQKVAIVNLLNYLNKNLQEITMIDIKNYFDNVIDKKLNKFSQNPISIDSKKAYRSYLTSFFDYVVGRFLEINIECRNPVPNKRIYKFARLEGDIKKQSEIKEKVFSEQELLYILEYSKKKSLRDFILFSLLTIDGARISEILTIKIKNVNLEQRFYDTGLEKDAQKSTHKSRKSLIFFFPQKFGPYLEQYINYIGKENIWLFPGRKTYLKYSGLRRHVERNYGKDFYMFHKFRATLISNRLTKMNCPLWISEGLTNHKISESTQIKHYAKFTIEQKRKMYDTYFPYYDFPYF